MRPKYPACGLNFIRWRGPLGFAFDGVGRSAHMRAGRAAAGGGGGGCSRALAVYNPPANSQ
jgi:hypothetical protein